MNKFVIASHGKLADGYKSALEIITGVTDINTVCGFIDNNNPDMQIKELMSSFTEEDDIYVFTDIAFGSVNRLFIPYINNHVHLISGVNLPFVCELILKQERISREEILEAIEKAKSQIVYMNYEIEKID